jgi:hypothetical protein
MWKDNKKKNRLDDQITKNNDLNDKIKRELLLQSIISLLALCRGSNQKLILIKKKKEEEEKVWSIRLGPFQAQILNYIRSELNLYDPINQARKNMTHLTKKKIHFDFKKNFKCFNIAFKKLRLWDFDLICQAHDLVGSKNFIFYFLFFIFNNTIVKYTCIKKLIK